jgi:opacity protein-like surface antigen
MKLIALTLSTMLLASTATYAGERVVSSGKEAKAQVVAPTTCFKDHELQVDLYGAYVDGNAPDHAGPWQDHGWGGGVGINYFFSRYIGIGIEGTVLDGRENPLVDQSRNRSAHSDHTAIWSGSGSLIARMPIDRLCLAPYAYVGGGVMTDGEDWATGFVGVGVEYRIVPEKIGLFIDARWNYYGDRFDRGDQNNFGAKAGVRFIF